MSHPSALNRVCLSFLLASAAMLFPTLAHAHPGHGEIHGWSHGFAHPIGGLDHLCAMIAVGLWAAQLGGRAIWLVPVAFVTAMAAGGFLGAVAVPIPFAEQGIVTSVLILGLLVTVAMRLPLAKSLLIVSLFAVFHGYAHGAEMPRTASGLAYGFGFLVATAMLHGIGVGAAVLITRTRQEHAVRFAGAAIALCGVYLCLS